MQFNHPVFKHIANYLSGKKDSIGKFLFDKWYQSYDDSEGYFKGKSSTEKKNHREKIFGKIEGQLESEMIPERNSIIKKIRTGPIFYFGLAALLMIGVMFSIFFFAYGSSWETGRDEVVLERMSTGTGEVLEVQLPDGSVAWLSAQSQIEYPENFSSTQRSVELQGEAFFDVIPNPDKPFLVNSGDVQTRVLGTSFTVKSYPDEEIKITLASGKVEVSSSTDSRKAVLTENQQIIYRNGSGFSDISNVDAALEQAWKNKELIFIRKSFEEIAKTFERWYDVEFVFRNTSVKEEEFVYHFTEYSLQNSLNILSQMADFEYEYEIETQKVYIDSKN